MNKDKAALNGAIQAYTNQDFVDTISRKFRAWAKNSGQEASPENMARFLMERSLINEKDVNRYMVIELYPHELYRHDCNKRKAIHSLEDKLPYQERTIWHIIGDMPRRFTPKKVGFLKRKK